MGSEKEEKTTRNVIIFIAVLVLIVTGYAVYVNVFAAPKYPQAYIPKPYDGNSSANVVITQYSDFECPACGYAEPIFRMLRAEYRDSVSFRYVHFPLTSIHPNAFQAAEASECANDQGRFWEFHDRLYENQRKLDSDTYYSIAKSLGLDLEQFRQCLTSGAKRETVLRDFNEALSKNLRGTPSFFVNGIAVENYAYENFKKIIEEELGR